MRVDAGEQGVVVQHLLEVRHHPVRVHAVPGEAAGQLVVHAAAGHRLSGTRGHGQGLLAAGRGRDPLGVPEQELKHHRRRELRRAAEAATARVELAGQAADGRITRGAQLQLTRVRGPGHALARLPGQRGGDLAGLLGDLVPVLAPGPGDAEDEPLELRPGEVGTAEEGLAVRRHEYGHRPAALAGHGLGGRHVHAVHVRPFLTVDLDGDHVLVHYLRGLLVLERLVRHHVAPVAGRVADREQHRDVPLPCRGKCLIRPGPPVHRVIGVLEEVRAGLPAEPCCHGLILPYGPLPVPRCGQAVSFPPRLLSTRRKIAPGSGKHPAGRSCWWLQVGQRARRTGWPQEWHEQVHRGGKRPVHCHGCHRWEPGAAGSHPSAVGGRPGLFRKR